MCLCLNPRNLGLFGKIITQRKDGRTCIMQLRMGPQPNNQCPFRESRKTQTLRKRPNEAGAESGERGHKPQTHGQSHLQLGEEAFFPRTLEGVRPC